MNPIESIALWEKCQKAKGSDDSSEAARTRARDLWNQWAHSLLEKRDQLKERNLWDVREDKCHLIGLNEESQAWIDEARVDFDSGIFGRASSDTNPREELSVLSSDKIPSHGAAIDFEGFIFPGECIFQQATFDGWVWFKKTEFHGPVQFTSATFLSWVGFQESRFHQRVWMNDVVFSDQAVFKKAVFHRYARFDLSEFNKISDFSNVQFFSDASFLAIHAKSGFLLDGSKFMRVPDFHQANFNEAPIIGVENVEERDLKDNYLQPFDESRRWGAMKRIANQAQDHQREHEIFVKELRSRVRARKNAKALLGFIYGIVSCYGQSVSRPTLGLISNAVMFFFVYWILSKLAVASNAQCAFPGGGVGAAKLLSIINSTPFFGSVLARGIGRDALVCVGIRVPELSGIVAIALSVQIILAAFFSFLVLLALRNYFRIR